MFLRKFPMDTQACPLYFGSLGYSRADLIYRWKTVEVPPLELSQYIMLKSIIDEENVTDIRNPNDGAKRTGLFCTYSVFDSAFG